MTLETFAFLSVLPGDALEQIATAGLPAVLMAIAIRWLVNSNEKQQGANRELMQQLNTERAERMDAMEEHISECKEHIKECDADRHGLRLELVRLARLAGPGEEVPHDPPTRHHPRPA